MSDFVSTHRTRPVEVMVKDGIRPGDGDCVRAWWKISGDQTACCLFSGPGFDALFELIPRPAVVKIPLDLAKALMMLDCVRGDLYLALERAVHAEAEAEEKT